MHPQPRRGARPPRRDPARAPGGPRAGRRLLADRETVIDVGRQEASRLVEQGRQERHRLVSETEVSQEADEEAERIIKTAQTDAGSIREEVDDYVDSKLANFEVVLNKTMQAVIRGRDRLRGARVEDELDPGPEQ